MKHSRMPSAIDLDSVGGCKNEIEYIFRLHIKKVVLDARNTYKARKIALKRSRGIQDTGLTVLLSKRKIFFVTAVLR